MLREKLILIMLKVELIWLESCKKNGNLFKSNKWLKLKKIRLWILKENECNSECLEKLLGRMKKESKESKLALNMRKNMESPRWMVLTRSEVWDLMKNLKWLLWIVMILSLPNKELYSLKMKILTELILSCFLTNRTKSWKLPFNLAILLLKSKQIILIFIFFY